MYPRSLFKKRGFLDELPLSTISEEVSLVSIRRISEPLQYNEFHGVKTLAQKPICDHEIIDMSMNVFGGKWRIKDLHYADKDKKLHANKLPGFFYTVFHPSSVIYYEKAYPLCISINAINNKEFIFPISFEDKKQRNAFFTRYPIDNDKYLKGDFNGQNSYVVECEISHKPTFLNYWHCVMNLKLDGTLLTTQPKSYKTIVAMFWEQLLSDAIIIDDFDESSHIIPCRLYQELRQTR